MAIEFNPGDHGVQGSYNDPIPPSSKMVGWVMKTGLVRDEKQANYVLLVFALLFFLATIWILVSKNPTATITTSVYLEDLPQEVLNTLTPEERASIPSRTTN